jgi:ribose transport system ATP-binding protein
MAAPHSPLLRLTSISKHFGSTRALENVDLELAPGSVHAIIGENGAGKSTLIRILAGEVQSDSGEVFLEGVRFVATGPAPARRLGIAHVKQELSLCPHLTVAENISLGMEPARAGWLDRQGLERRALGTLEQFRCPQIDPQAKIASLPIGARQLVEICRALAQNPRILLLDEPTSSLQKSEVERLFELIRSLKQRGVGVLYISHFLEEVREIGDHFTVLRDGRSVATGVLSSAGDHELIAAMVGREPEQLYPARIRREPGEVVLSVRNLSAPPAVRKASFELGRGDVLGIAGLIGGGRSEMVRAIFGLMEAQAGEVIVNGQPLGRRTPQKSTASGLGYLTEDRRSEGLALQLTVADNMTLTRLSSFSRFGWLRRAAEEEQTQRWVAALKIRTPNVWTRVQALSGGNQQKVLLARLLHQDAQVYLLDEPTRGIDIGSKVQIYAMISRLADEGKAVLVVSSYLPELLGICDRIAVMRRGVLSEARPAHEWTPEQVIAEAVGARRQMSGTN